nr:class I SAM-dependent methyltransferase [Desulfurispora thermophila]
MAMELAKRGARVTGIDFSPAMLSRATRKAKSLAYGCF